MRTRIDTLERSQTEPIAIIGMGCRFPGGAITPEAYWQLLQDGVDATREVPANRWAVKYASDPKPAHPGQSFPRRGGFLDQIDQFDAKFFGLSPREAASMDPQQRLLLEVSWEALEQAGVAPSRLMGSHTGVFVGISLSEYLHSALFADAAAIDLYTATGNALSVAAGRIAYYLGLQGPAIAIDTACSSALVAVHLACQSLRLRECRLALAGGVYLMLAPQITLAMAKLNALSADGRCKTFDAGADGYGRGEGCGVIALKRLTDAQADGDRILAVIRGSAVNQDGRSSGLTVPNGTAQQALVWAALQTAQVAPEQIQYVEAHGTGTPLGDPIEVQSLATVLGNDRSSPLMIGSVKTNIGHLEAAAGIASLIKVVLAMHYQEIPPHLHLQQVNPRLDLTATRITIPTQRTPWLVAAGQSRLAGVSAFGFSGTNAHLILESAPQPSRQSPPGRPTQILCLSAKTDSALQRQVDQMLNYLQAQPDVDLADVCVTANTGRSHFARRVAFLPSGLADLQARLQAYATGQPLPDRGGAESTRNSQPASLKLAFYFPHECTQSLTMGRQWYTNQPEFQAAFNDCRCCLDRHQADLFLEIWQGDAFPSEHPTLWQRLLTAARQYALAQLWRSWGLEPGILLGDGIGQRVADCVSGSLSLEVLLQTAFAAADPSSETLETVAIASSPHLSPNATTHAPASISSAVMETLQTADCQVVVVMGSHPTALESEASTLMRLWLPSLAPDQADGRVLLHSLSQLYGRGADINWTAVEQGQARSPISLPTYPFERQRYWLDTVSPPPSPKVPIADTSSHPVWGRRLASPLSSIQFETQWHLDALPLVRDHRLHQQAVVNLVVYLEMVQAAAIAALGHPVSQFESLLVPQALILQSEQPQTVQLIITPQTSKQAEFQIFSLNPHLEEPQWVSHISGQIQWHRSPQAIDAPSLDIARVQNQCASVWDAATFYQQVQAHGAELGDSCRILKTIWRRDGEALGQLALSELAESQPYRLPLQALDACFQLLTACLPSVCTDVYIILSLQQLQIDCLDRRDRPVWAYAQLDTPIADWSDPSQTATLSAHIMLLDAEGRCLVKAMHLQLRRWKPTVSAIRAPARPLLATCDRSVGESGPVDLSQLLALPAAEQLPVMECYLMDTIAHLLRLPNPQLNGQQSLAALIDSLIAFELRNQIEIDLHIRLSIEQFLGTATITQLAISILEQLAIAPFKSTPHPFPSAEMPETMESLIL
jgi:acyl transferase domain-containing protein